MKKSKILASMMIAIMAFSTAACGAKTELDDQAAVREYDPNDTSVYIVDEETALVGSIADASMTEAELQRSAELRAMAVSAFNACNEQRIAAGLPAYVWSDDLAIAAQVRAKECVTNFSHTRPNGTDYWTVNGNIVYGENLARGYKTVSGVVDGWMNSPTHRANIMDRSLVTLGIAIYENADGSMYWAQEFGY